MTQKEIFKDCWVQAEVKIFPHQQWHPWRMCSPFFRHWFVLQILKDERHFYDLRPLWHLESQWHNPDTHPNCIISIIGVGTPEVLHFFPCSQSQLWSWERALTWGCLGSHLILLSMFGALYLFSFHFLCPDSSQEIPQPESSEPGTYVPKSKIGALLSIEMCHWAYFIFSWEVGCF